ncbi:TetR-like C-terminal domain-containing protein [Streptomyces sp. NPDC048506]|uniref:TetR-like C-terminal domain-containing protein n=1 Tax=Streptomyces sp. NPDC048506 TaxID=3155028 RepID=UPI00341247D5
MAQAIAQADSDSAEDPRSTLHALAGAYRSWAVAQPHRYPLIQGTPLPGYAAPSDTLQRAGRPGTVPEGVRRRRARKGATAGRRRDGRMGTQGRRRRRLGGAAHETMRRRTSSNRSLRTKSGRRSVPVCKPPRTAAGWTPRAMGSDTSRTRHGSSVRRAKRRRRARVLWTSAVNTPVKAAPTAVMTAVAQPGNHTAPAKAAAAATPISTAHGRKNPHNIRLPTPRSTSWQ